MLKFSTFLILFNLSFITVFGAENLTSKKIRLMSYNVENLFDTEHDEGKNDWTFIPKSHPGKFKGCELAQGFYREQCFNTDWTEDRLKVKLQQIKFVIEKTGPELPDIVALSEVENEKVVRKLADVAGYKEIIVTDSPDERGIDEAIMYNPSPNFKYLKHLSHPIDPKLIGNKPTRDVLEVQFQINNEKLALLVNHWPSQAAPTQVRIKVAEIVAQRVKELKKQGFIVIATGDFNVDDVGDQPSPFLAFGNPLDNPLLVDIDALARKKSSKKSSLLLGTYFYGNPGSENSPPAMKWNALDRFFVSPELLNDGGELKVELTSYRIFSVPEMETTYEYTKGPYSGTKVQRAPLSYDHNAKDPAKAGFSDHFPILLDIKL
jgi:endonuclease/exonuclease/phosphatase family metal-dependent hydrolase